MELLASSRQLRSSSRANVNELQSDEDLRLGWNESHRETYQSAQGVRFDQQGVQVGAAPAEDRHSQ